MRPITALQAQWQATSATGEALKFEHCKGGYFSDMEEYGLRVTGATEQNGTPTPDAPVPIQCVKAGTVVRCVGKNLCPPLVIGVGINPTNGAIVSSMTSATTSKIYVDFSKHVTYTVTGIAGTINSFVAAYDEHDGFVGRTSGSRRSKMQLSKESFTSGNGSGDVDGICYLIFTQYETSSSLGTISDVKKLQTQVESGDIETPYEPYASGVEITTPCDLYEGDVWWPMTGKVVRHVLLITLTGNEKWSRQYEERKDVIQMYCDARKYEIIGVRYGTMWCTIAKQGNAGSSNTKGNQNIININQNGTNLLLDLSLEQFPTEKSVTDYLKLQYKENPVKVLVTKANPIIEQYTPRPIFAPAGTAVVEQIPADLPGTLSATMLTRRAPEHGKHEDYRPTVKHTLGEGRLGEMILGGAA